MFQSFSRFAFASAVSLLAVLAASTIGCAAESADDVSEGAEAIVGGTVARPNAWPGTVAVYYGRLQGCGGSLVASSWVVTAAHCIDTGSLGGITEIVIGRQKLSSDDGETRTIDRVIRHEGFNQNLDNDIALLHLSTPSTYPTVSLVTAGEAAAAAAAGASVTVVGWGDTKENGHASDVLRQVSLPVISKAKCTSYAEYENVTDNQICAAKAGKDSCQGDSGGPLFQTVGGHKVQVGLVSWGIGCARPNEPGVYTRLGKYLDWMSVKSDGAIGATAS
jgi:trypsin